MDNTIGPRVDPSIRAFDFTALFEECFLDILPWSLFLLMLLVRLKFLLNRPKIIRVDRLCLIKEALWTLYAVVKLAQLILWASIAAFTTAGTVPAAALAFVGCMGGSVLSYFEHCRSRRPSSLLGILTLLILLCDVTRVRTMWLMDQPRAISILTTAALPINILLLVFESLTKTAVANEKEASRSKEEIVGILNRSVFWWLNSLFILGRKHVLHMGNLPRVDSKVLTSYAAPKVYERWESKPQSLMLQSLQAYPMTLLRGGLCRLFTALFVTSQPLLLKRTIRWFSEPSTPVSDAEGYGLIGAYLVVYGGRAVFTALAQHQNYRLITMIRASLVSLIYDRTLTLDLVEAKESAALTLMSTDVERIGQGLQFVHEIWATPAEFGVAIFLLQREVALGSLAPVIIIIVAIVGTVLLSMKIDPHQKEWIGAIERRIGSTTDMLRNMRGVKMSGFEDALTSILQAMRVEEVNISRATKLLFIGCQVFSTATATISPVLGFTIYVLMQRAQGKPGLASSSAFTSLSLFSILSSSVYIFLTSVPAIFSGISCFARVENYLVSENITGPTDAEGQDSEASSISAEKISIIAPKIAPSDYLLVIRDGSVRWKGQEKAVLSQINLCIEQGSFCVISGSVGSGKSSLLYAILGEASLKADTFHISTTSIAYCQQSPWLPDISVKECVLNGRDWDEDLYKRVIHACALSEDLAQLSAGDHTKVGYEGGTLSGGQRQRVALARALYSRRRLLLLDDTFSALDPKTEKSVSGNLFSSSGLLRELGTTVICTTGKPGNSNKYADYTLDLNKEGEAQLRNTQKDMQDDEIEASTYSREQNGPKKQEEDANHESNQSPETSQEHELAQESVPTFSSMIFYLRSTGMGFFALSFSLSLVYSFWQNFPTIWVNLWTQHDAKHPYGDLAKYIGVYILCAVLALVTHTVVTWAPMSYFESVDIGTITNHFSQDMEKVDLEIPLTGVQALFAFTSALVQLVMLSIGTKWMAITFPFIIAILAIIQRQYLKTSRQLRLLDLEAKSPLYSHFTETLSGLATIRAFGTHKQCQSINTERLDCSQGPFYLLYCAQRWLTLVLNLVIGAMAILMMGVTIKLRGSTGAGYIGLAFVNLTTFSQSIQSLLTWWTMMEASIGAVHRVQQFEKETPQEDVLGQVTSPPHSWPKAGLIELKELSASYLSSVSPVLRNVTFTVQPGQKVGICGRTGSGKTSLILCLQRMIKINSGSILIDGLNTSHVPAKTLRERLICIPQDALIFNGTVRLNLDPQSSFTDKQLQDNLRRVELWDLISSKGGLDATMQDGLLSHGQLQLFCLSRVLQKKSPIVILDEVSSSADEESQRLISKIIREDFKDRTVISIAHRLQQIADFDIILVFSQGQLVEQGSPEDLLGRDVSLFQDLFSQQDK
ncbi:unnamed protein product [Fusarium graminearum]|nr:unnamed protein product [Fusarium graminearum]